ncbi:MAG: hypothetical protein J6P56_07470 [Bacteroidales bacterium]|nr:hypothetical protein [Bacteroidales bacterium]
MKTRITVICAIAFLLCTLSAGAQEKHLVRLGWGDALYETLVFHPADGTSAHTYSGHWFADYQYQLTPLISLGGQADFQSICWTKNGSRVKNFDLCILPTVRFTWLRKEWVRLYSGAGIGVLVAWDNAGGKDLAPALNINSIGVQVGKGHWSGSVDLGLMAALKGTDRIYMFGSRLLSVSVNYRW